jgi:hypothetical protein
MKPDEADSLFLLRGNMRKTARAKRAAWQSRQLLKG